MVHGIPIKIRTVNELGNDEPKTVMFASVRKHPKLREFINKLDELEGKEQIATRVLFASFEKLEDVKDKDRATVEAASQKAQKEYQKIVTKRLETIQDFIIEGMIGAGYGQDNVDLYLPYFDPDRYQELINRSLVGCGRLDFFAENSPAPENLNSM